MGPIAKELLMTTTMSLPSTPKELGEGKIQPRGLIQRFIFSWIDSFEKQSGVSADYCRWMANVSPRAFLKFGKLGKLAQYRRALPADASAVAHLVAARSEDCGPCVQIGVNFALRDGVSKEIVRAVLDRQPDRLPPKLADVYRFADSVVSGGDDDALRERVRGRYGDEALIEMGLAMAVGRTFPVVKRAIGYAKSCSLVKIEI
jgi:alkylhydroperoxidase family enzyme